MENSLKDGITTGAGGTLAAYFLLQVRWEQVPFGQVVLIGVAFALLWSGYFMYGRKKGDANGN